MAVIGVIIVSLWILFQISKLIYPIYHKTAKLGGFERDFPTLAEEKYGVSIRQHNGSTVFQLASSVAGGDDTEMGPGNFGMWDTILHFDFSPHAEYAIIASRDMDGGLSNRSQMMSLNDIDEIAIDDRHGKLVTVTVYTYTKDYGFSCIDRSKVPDLNRIKAELRQYRSAKRKNTRH